MCGRYATTRSSADLSRLFEAFDETEGGVTVDYNVAPTDKVPIVRVSASREARVLTVARWGLVPPWATDPRIGSRMINARAETVASSRAYAQSFERRRCLVPVDGWYEWTRSPTGKQAFYMNMNGEGLTMGGIWSVKGDLLTFSVITLPARGDLAKVHDRMPLLLPPDRWSEWLSATPSDDLLTPADDDYLSTIEIRAVGSAVGDVRNDGPGLIEPIEAGLLF
ncbi:MAG: SOS response-associated peptidase [Hamadaea sp.]|uniref:SOS response-associated peptidase n=1 Tax=Hamadaea sp. TaxID=2024425 RepID=UPI00180FF8FB|nr:SOS response-associated peptidase [Hamadaea sp.]NUR69787.1 SOS response-associated peptidase [Hamadaea sp.]NUT22630.1 SOS response-associated peptidase [Hamadaea sp.]